MLNSIIASAALLASATVVDALGSAVVLNHCPQTVQVDAVPAVGNTISQSLQEGGTFSQQWTALSTGGWSIKLSYGGGEPLQYEYTLQTDGTLWFDLSAVNADPFGGDWFISGGTGCTTKQTAYQYPTDDANGMQDTCSAESTVTLTLCASGGAAPDPVPNAASAAPSVASPFASAETAPSAAPTPDSTLPTPSVPVVAASDVSGFANNFNKLQATTFNTKIAPAAHTVTNVHTQVVTQFVTVSPSPVKRSEHVHRHAERHNHF